MPDPYWNHNVHYQKLVLRAVPDGCEQALDVGCGDGLLVGRLAGRVPAVTGADRSAAAITMARERHGHLPNASFLEADYLDGALPEGAYDFVSAVAVVHHADFRQALDALVRLLAPGGRLMIIGLGRNRSPLDWTISGAGQLASRIAGRPHGGKSGPGQGVPAMDPITSWGEIGRVARAVLPGCRFRRLLLRRYCLLWEKPRDGRFGRRAS